jgi:hypothetical protein
VVAVVVAFAIQLASEARAEAPAQQYGAFDQFVAVISDNKTGLYWQRGFGPQTDYWGALAYCQSLSLPSYPSGWRVPSYKELLTLVDEQPHTEYGTGVPTQVAIDPNAFGPGLWGGTPGAPFWSSSVVILGGRAYDVDFSDGTVNRDQLSQLNYVRCVQP